MNHKIGVQNNNNLSDHAKKYFTPNKKSLIKNEIFENAYIE